MNGPCEAQIRGVCTGRAQHKHHKVMRSHGRDDSEENLMLMCLACHTYTHANPKESYEKGFLIRANGLPLRKGMQ